MTQFHDQNLIARWLSRHGGPRRFEPGALGEAYALKQFLKARGYTVRMEKNATAMRLRLTMRQARAQVDRLRIAEGLEPLVLANRAEAAE
jgi:hypothetical protein